MRHPEDHYNLSPHPFFPRSFLSSLFSPFIVFSIMNCRRLRFFDSFLQIFLKYKRGTSDDYGITSLHFHMDETWLNIYGIELK